MIDKPAFDEMVGTIRDTLVDERLLSRTPLAMLIHFELLKAVNDLEIYGNRARIREAYALLYEYDVLNGLGRNVQGKTNGYGFSLSSINVCASDRLASRTASNRR